MHAIVYFFQACRPNYLMLRRNACSYLYLCPNFYLFCGKSAEIHSGKTETALSKRRRLFLSFSKPNVFDSAKRRCLSHPQNVYTFPKTHPASWTVCTGESFPLGVERPGCEADDSPPSAKDWNEWSYTSTPPCVVTRYIEGGKIYLVPSKLIFKRRLQILIFFYCEQLLTQLSIITKWDHREDGFTSSFRVQKWTPDPIHSGRGLAYMRGLDWALVGVETCTCTCKCGVKKVRVKQSRYTSGVAQRVPGS